MAKESTVKIEYSSDNIQVKPIQELRDFTGLFKTVSTAPTGVPRKMIDQVVVYVNGATLRLYWFDAKAGVWHYVTATA